MGGSAFRSPPRHLAPLHSDTDYVRFHATCKPWRDTLPSATCYPAFLPWLLSPPDSSNHRKARDVFSSSKSTHRGTSAAVATGIWAPDRRVVISQVDGTVIFTLTDICLGGLTNPLISASATRLPLPSFSSDREARWWADHADGVVSGNGTILLYLIGSASCRPYYLPTLNAALLRPGDAEWTMLSQDLRLDPCCCVAHHDGKIIIIRHDGYTSCIQARPVDDNNWWVERDTDTPLPSAEDGKALQCSYLLESRGKLLLANVLAYDAQGYSMASFVEGLSVSIHVLQETNSGQIMWVKWDGPLLADRVVFLGRPRSFAMDATSFGEIRGGHAYFVIKSQLYRGFWSNSAIKRCRVLKYSFQDHKSELVEELPVEWDDDTCMWLPPLKPFMASTEEIREHVQEIRERRQGILDRLQPLHGKAALVKKHDKPAAAGGPQFGSYFGIYVGNLPRNVDSYRLGQFFGKYGKVAEARVMCHIKTKRSRGFGFVTMAIGVDHEQEDAVALMDGQILDGRPVRVKFAHRKQQHVPC